MTRSYRVWMTSVLIGFAVVGLAGRAPAADPPPAADAAKAQQRFESAKALAADRQHDKALADYAAALALAPARAEVHAYKAASHLALGQHEAAQAEIDSALKLDDRDYTFHVIAGQIQLAAGRLHAGRAQYERAAALSPPNAGAVYTDYAAALAARNDPQLSSQIESALKSAAAADPPSAEAVFQLGQSYATAGRPGAKQYLQRYVELANKLPEGQRDARKIKVAKQLIRALDALK